MDYEYAMKAQAQAQAQHGAANSSRSLLGESVECQAPREVDMLIKRTEECVAYAISIHERLSVHLDRLLGQQPKNDGNQSPDTISGGGSIYNLNEVLSRLERRIVFIDNESRRLEGL